MNANVFLTRRADMILRPSAQLGDLSIRPYLSVYLSSVCLSVRCLFRNWDGNVQG